MRIFQSKQFICFICSCLYIPVFLTGQMLPEFQGARAAATGMASVATSDVWAIQNNIGALAGLETPTLAFGYNTRLNLQELSSFGALLGYPLQTGVASASFTRFGTGAYHLQSAGLGYSHQISYVSLGVKVSYLQQSVEGYESVGTFALEAGGKAELLPKLHFAAHAFNLTQASFETVDRKELIPVLLKAGLAYLPSDYLTLSVQTLKDVSYPARFSAGLDYQIRESLALRTGIMTAPVVASFGVGFCTGEFCFDYAFRHHNIIGVAHHLSIGYSFRKNGKE